jgi:hypothetical protein
MSVNGKETIATSNIIGAKTTIDKDSNGKTKVVTKVETTNEFNQAVEIEIDAQADGSAVHKVEVNGIITQATSQIAGAVTTIATSGDVETNSTLPNTTNKAVVIAKADGSAEHRVILDNEESQATTDIKGANTVISTTGEVKTTVGDIVDNNNIIKAEVITRESGESITRFVKVNSNDVTDVVLIGNTLDINTPYTVGSDVNITKSNGVIHIQTTTPVLNSAADFTIE